MDLPNRLQGESEGDICEEITGEAHEDMHQRQPEGGEEGAAAIDESQISEVSPVEAQVQKEHLKEPEVAQTERPEGEVAPAQAEPVSLEARTMRVGIVIYHRLTGTRYDLICTIRHGSRRITIDGVPIEELIERNYIAPIASLLERMRSERLSLYDVDITIGGLEWSQHINPFVMGYALSDALANILSSL
ncbi:MAG: hypothetical protein RMK18_05110 [Armatimonadota bacterium]|nr:hypothetical protein [Armatimonadota bacterium]MCX7776627.1 hypothetical protein [Armatimonadota bacterium]MDW8025230.1 hypothetical protein [Armatimonadota bacterium]